MPLGDTIFKRLEIATDEEINEIWKALKIKDKPTGNRELDSLVISKEYRAAAGHFLGNLFRGDHDFLYKQILIDVADGLMGRTHFKLEDDHSVIEIEEAIYQYWSKIVEEKLNNLSEEQRKEIADQVKRQTARIPIKRDLITIFSVDLPLIPMSTFYLGLGRLVSKLGGPNYSKTIPTTILFIAIRKRAEAEKAIK